MWKVERAVVMAATAMEAAVDGGDKGGLSRFSVHQFGAGRDG